MGIGSELDSFDKHTQCFDASDTFTDNANQSGELKKIGKICLFVGISLSIVIFVCAVFRGIATNSENIEKLREQVNTYKTDLQIMQKEIDTLNVFVDKPLEAYTIRELMTIEAVKEFDATYRQELDDDPNIGDYMIVDSKNIGEEFAFRRTNSNSPIIIERAFGIVQDNELNGKLIDCGNMNEYISYCNVKNAHRGDLILSYIMYTNNNIDDITVREDFVIDLFYGD